MSLMGQGADVPTSSPRRQEYPRKLPDCCDAEAGRVGPRADISLVVRARRARQEMCSPTDHFPAFSYTQQKCYVDVCSSKLAFGCVCISGAAARVAGGGHERPFQTLNRCIG